MHEKNILNKLLRTFLIRIDHQTCQAKRNKSSYQGFKLPSKISLNPKFSNYIDNNKFLMRMHIKSFMCSVMNTDYDYNEEVLVVFCYIVKKKLIYIRISGELL